MTEQQTESYTPRVGDRVRVRRYVRAGDAPRTYARTYAGRITEASPEAGGWFIFLDTHPDRIFTGYQWVGNGSLVTEVTQLDDTDGREAYRVQVTPDMAVTLDGSQCVVLEVSEAGCGCVLHRVTISNVAALKTALDGALAAQQVMEAAGNARRYAGPDAARRARGQLARPEAVEYLIAQELSRSAAVSITGALRDGRLVCWENDWAKMTYADGYWRVPVADGE